MICWLYANNCSSHQFFRYRFVINAVGIKGVFISIGMARVDATDFRFLFLNAEIKAGALVIMPVRYPARLDQVIGISIVSISVVVRG